MWIIVWCQNNMKLFYVKYTKNFENETAQLLFSFNKLYRKLQDYVIL